MANKKENDEVKNQIENIYRGNQNNKNNLKAEIDSERIKEDILKMSEIALWLDTYDDIFSDFDPRPFNQRSVSVDMLDELKRASRDKASGQTELKFLIPAKDRKLETELNIKKRLKDHFKRHFEEINNGKKKIFAKAITFVILGFAMLFFAAYIDHLGKSGLLYSAIVIFFEPAGWFTFWFSLEQIFDYFKEKNPEAVFYEKMSNAEISFISY
jgi:hypothetical protein